MKPIFLIPILLSLVVSITALVLISYYGNILHKAPKFSALTNYFSSSTPAGVLPIGCTNLTLGGQTKEFSGKTFLASTCPQTDNPCSEFFCNTEGYCNEMLVENATCYQSAQCGNFSRCDLTTCECIEFTPPECTIDSDCGIDNSNPCVEILCVSGECMKNLTTGAECSSTTGCLDGYTCISNCTCQVIVSDFSVSPYTPTILAHETYSQPFDLPFSYMEVDYENFFNYARIDMQIVATSNTSITTGNRFGFLFSLPTIADTSENSTGIFAVSQTDNININTSFFGSGSVSLYNSLFGLALAPNENYAYIGPNDGGSFSINLYFIYKKL